MMYWCTLFIYIYNCLLILLYVWSKRLTNWLFLKPYRFSHIAIIELIVFTMLTDKIIYQTKKKKQWKFNLKLWKKKIPVFKTISIINNLLTEKRKLLDGLPEDLTLSNLVYLYAPLTSTNIERCFLKYKY
jgi:hypothetical protein